MSALAPDPMRDGSARRMRRVFVAVAFAVAIAAALHSSETTAHTQTPGSTATDARWESHATWSPDSRRVAFESNASGNLDIVIRDVESGRETPFTTDSADDEEPSWEPGGECLAFRSGREGGGIFVQCPDRPARRVAPDGHDPRWSTDGSRLLYTSQSNGVPALHVVPRESGNPVSILASLTSTLVGPIRAVWTAQGQRIAVIGTHPTEGAGLWVLDANASEVPQAPAQRLTRLLLRMQARNPPAFLITPDGGALYVSGRDEAKATLFRLALDPVTSAVRGGPEPVARWSGEAVDATISPSGTRIAAGVRSSVTRVFVFPFDAAAGRIDAGGRRIVGPADARSVFPDFSPDGNLLLYTVVRDQGATELRVWSANSGADVLLSADGAFRFGPRWSPSGTSLSYRWHGTTDGRAVSGVRMIDLAARRESVVTRTAFGVPYTPFGWSLDGQQILASFSKEKAGVESVGLVALPVASAPNAERKQVTLAAPEGFKLWQARTSPDGKWVVVNIQPSGDDWSSIAVVPITGGEYTRLTNDADAWDEKPRWSPDGRTVYFLSRRTGDFELWRVGFDPGTGQAVGDPTRLTTLTTPRRHVLRDIGHLDLGLSASRLAVPIEETRSRLSLDEAPAVAGPPLTLCTVTEPLADAAIPAGTEALTMPVVRFAPPPRFPERALQQGVAGMIPIEAIVNADGTVRPVCVNQKIDRDLVEESLATVRRWRFTPGRLNDKPVPVLATFGVSYNIQQRE